ncbi:tRNA methyltransferase, has a role in tRNA modification [Spathaspora passalidarum NRRL Y-27907]|uniref:tRNA methyltransferase, has a role in tRNA modification n=1 Tax=Spathaspora passalidarum (strain NRRL Y-27907 / 11-Y1) TaxID=619300 RepID=G3AJN1_SPAPN|nr:tRNA methyltransferase, has a role in tRNA modification [Spathaspora passalidarum NRRL Y-27907]EGW33932.1 tRNA methyltransferase, has a role in tRNA modification [Spathaspora passalidarum NRRL Y-27907]
MSVPSVSIERGLDPKAQEQDFVHDVYNEIASHFSQTRYKPWPIVEKFLKTRSDYSIGLDVGCGNGKYLGINDKLFIIGTDHSEGLVRCGQDISENSYNLGIADGLSLPHPESRFDFAISIAVIHHFANEERRVQAISHILSKLKVGGECLIYCWALEQEKSRRGYKEGDDQDILIPWVLKKPQPKKEKKKKSKMMPQDSTVESTPELTEKSESEDPLEQHSANTPKKEEPKEEEQDQTKYRYYHLYRKGELSENALKTGSCTIVDEGYEKDNWWVIIKKI